MSDAFDPAPYVRAPIISVSSGVTLAQTLLSATPKNADPKVKKAAKHLKAVADKALADLTERNKKLGEYTEEDSRVLDNEADRAWGALRMRLQAIGMLTEFAKADAKRAVALDTILFQGSTAFLKSDYAVQNTRMSSILKQIDEDGLQADIDRLAGPQFLGAVRDVQPRYEAMVKEKGKRDTASGQDLNETVRALQAAIVNYASKVTGTVEHDDPASAEAARVALLPILNFRDAAAHAAAAAKAPPAPAAPTGGAAPAGK